MSDIAPRILVVEDEMMIAMMLEDWLADLGYAVAGPHAHLRPAIEAARQENVAAAVLDVNIDGEVVYGVAEVLAARDIPFVFASGYGAAALTAPWIDRPSLSKPFTRGDLAKSLARLVASSAGGERAG